MGSELKKKDPDEKTTLGNFNDRYNSKTELKNYNNSTTKNQRNLSRSNMDSLVIK